MAKLKKIFFFKDDDVPLLHQEGKVVVDQVRSEDHRLRLQNWDHERTAALMARAGISSTEGQGRGRKFHKNTFFW